MKQETIEEEVAALWVHYEVIEKMTGAYSEYFETWAGDQASRGIPADLLDTVGQIPGKKDQGIEHANEGQSPENKPTV